MRLRLSGKRGEEADLRKLQEPARPTLQWSGFSG